MNQDEQHLQLLSIFHYIVGGLAALFACFPIIYLVLGLIMLFVPQSMQSNGEPPPVFIGWIFVGIGTFFMLIGWSFAICVLMAGRFLSKRKNYMFCLVIGCVECIFMPFGTILGVFTIILLIKDSVKQLFSIIPPTSSPASP